MVSVSNEQSVLILLDKLKAGEEDSMGLLLAAYRPLVDAKVSEYSHVLEPDDIRQLCAIGIFEAAQSYDRTRSGDGVTFGLYAKVCVRNRLLSELRKIRPTHDPMDEDLLSDDASVEEIFIRREELSSAIEAVYRQLTEYENLVLKLYLAGKSYADVARILDRPVKSVDNAMSRIRTKFRNKL